MTTKSSSVICHICPLFHYPSIIAPENQVPILLHCYSNFKKIFFPSSLLGYNWHTALYMGGGELGSIYLFN